MVMSTSTIIICWCVINVRLCKFCIVAIRMRNAATAYPQLILMAMQPQNILSTGMLWPPTTINSHRGGGACPCLLGDVNVNLTNDMEGITLMPERRR